MNLLMQKKNFKVSESVFQKIIRDWKSEIKENKKVFEKLNKLDYQYNKKIVYIDKVIEAIDLYKDCVVCEKETKNVMVIYYGDPYTTVQLCLEALLNCQRLNIVIEEVCLGINKLLIELYKTVLKDYKIYDIVSFNNYNGKNSLERNKDVIDKVYCLGDENVYNTCRHIQDLHIEYISFDNISIYCENEELYELAKDTFEYCYENGIEAEIFDEMSFDETINYLNKYKKSYYSLILTKNKEYIERFKNEVDSKFVFANENPFKNNLNLIPKIF